MRTSTCDGVHVYIKTCDGVHVYIKTCDSYGTCVHQNL